MEDGYDDTEFTAPQFGMTQFDRIVANSSQEGSFLNILFKIRQNPLALPAFIIVIAGGVLTVY